MCGGCHRPSCSGLEECHRLDMYRPRVAGNALWRRFSHSLVQFCSAESACVQQLIYLWVFFVYAGAVKPRISWGPSSGEMGQMIHIVARQRLAAAVREWTCPVQRFRTEMVSSGRLKPVSMITILPFLPIRTNTKINVIQNGSNVPPLPHLEDRQRPWPPARMRVKRLISFFPGR